MSGVIEPTTVNAENAGHCLRAVALMLVSGPLIVVVSMAGYMALTEAARQWLPVAFSVTSGATGIMMLYITLVQLPTLLTACLLHRAHRRSGFRAFLRKLSECRYAAHSVSRIMAFMVIFAVIFMIISPISVSPEPAGFGERQSQYGFLAYIALIYMILKEHMLLQGYTGGVLTEHYVRTALRLNWKLLLGNAVVLYLIDTVVNQTIAGTMRGDAVQYAGLAVTSLLWMYVLFSNAFPKKASGKCPAWGARYALQK